MQWYMNSGMHGWTDMIPNLIFFLKKKVRITILYKILTNNITSVFCTSLCMLGNFACFFCRLWIFSKLTFFKKKNTFQEYNQCQIVWTKHPQQTFDVRLTLNTRQILTLDLRCILVVFANCFDVRIWRCNNVQIWRCTDVDFWCWLDVTFWHLSDVYITNIQLHHNQNPTSLQPKSNVH